MFFLKRNIFHSKLWLFPSSSTRVLCTPALSVHQLSALLVANAKWATRKKVRQINFETEGSKLQELKEQQPLPIGNINIFFHEKLKSHRWESHFCFLWKKQNFPNLWVTAHSFTYYCTPGIQKKKKWIKELWANLCKRSPVCIEVYGYELRCNILPLVPCDRNCSEFLFF